MDKRPFELCGRRRVDGGVDLVFQCNGCGGEATLLIKDEDELRGDYPLACPCGVEANMYFGAPTVGRALMRSLKDMHEPADDYRRCSAPTMN